MSGPSPRLIPILICEAGTPNGARENLSRAHIRTEQEKVSLHTFLASSTKMLLLQPSMVMLSFLTLIHVGSVSWGMTRKILAGAWIAMVTLDHLLRGPFVQYVRVVAGR